MTFLDSHGFIYKARYYIIYLSLLHIKRKNISVYRGDGNYNDIYVDKVRNIITTSSIQINNLYHGYINGSQMSTHSKEKHKNKRIPRQHIKKLNIMTKILHDCDCHTNTRLFTEETRILS